ncbi:unnamed protein product [Dicrocoelium dendriticum]|nr:unnamed protein product [Dicrocoelium dendriticum]
MTDLLRAKQRSFHFADDARLSFEKLKDAISNIALLAHPDTSAPLSLTTDASDTAVGAVLQQLIDHRNEAGPYRGAMVCVPQRSIELYWVVHFSPSESLIPDWSMVRGQTDSASWSSRLGVGMRVAPYSLIWTPCSSTPNPLPCGQVFEPKALVENPNRSPV